MKNKLNERLKIIKEKNKNKNSASVDSKPKKSVLIGERAKFLQQHLFNNRENNNNENSNRKINKSADKINDVNDIINSKPVTTKKKKMPKKIFFQE